MDTAFGPSLVPAHSELTKGVIARSALYVRLVVKTRCSVRPERTTSEQIIIQITKVTQRGGHMSLSSETLKTRFLKNCSKKGQSWTAPRRFVQIGTTFGLTFLNTFENHFLTCVASPAKKLSEPVILCHSPCIFSKNGRLRAPAVHGVSS